MVIIRGLNEADAPAFRALRLRALHEHPEAFGASYEDALATPVEGMAARLRHDDTWPYNFVLGAFDNTDALIGMIGFMRQSGEKVRHKGAIWGMYVARESVGLGMGRALMERAIVEARQQPGLEQIELTVVSTNEAVRHLYQSVGFIVYGVEPQALKVGGEYVDEDLMVLRLL